LNLNCQNVLIGLLLALACCGLWRLLIWFLEGMRAAINWTKARLLWPTAMLVWGWMMLGLFFQRESWGWAFDAVLFSFGLINFPVLVVVGVLLELFNQPAVWVQILVGSAAMWAGNYFLVRLAEWRAWTNVPVSLHIAEDEANQQK